MPFEPPVITATLFINSFTQGLGLGHYIVLSSYFLKKQAVNAIQS